MVAGTLGTMVEDEVMTAKPGTWLIKPRGQWHTMNQPALSRPGDWPSRPASANPPSGGAALPIQGAHTRSSRGGGKLEDP